MISNEINIKGASTSNNFNDFLTKVNPDPKAVDLYELEMRKSDVPILADVQQNFYDNRLDSQETGLYQKALQQERRQLYDGLLQNLAAVSDVVKKTLSNNDLDFIKFFPNSRFAWFNKFTKLALKNKAISQCDYKFLGTIWMNQSAKTQMLSFFQGLVDNSLTSFTIPPTQSRSGIPLTCEGTNLVAQIKNPGKIYIGDAYKAPGRLTQYYGSEEHGCNCSEDVQLEKVSDILESYMQGIRHLEEQVQLYHETKHLDDLGNNDTIRNLQYVRERLLDRHFSYEQMKDIADALNRIVDISESKYVISLMDPFKHRNARIPSLISIPTATFSVRSILTLNTNASGNLAFVINPFHLTTAGSSSAYVNNHATLTGAAANNNFLAVDIGQNLPVNLYERYRLVSAGLRMYFYPSSNSDNGIATIGTVYSPVVALPLAGLNAALQAYGAFNFIENSHFKKTVTVASREMPEQNYTPIDLSGTDFVNTNQTNLSSAWVGYITGAAGDASVARMEIILNYEAVVVTELTDYLPSEEYTVTPKDLASTQTAVARIRSGGKVTALSPLQKLEMTSTVLPPTSKEVSDLAKQLDTSQMVMKDIINKYTKDMTRSSKGGFLTSLLDMINPVAAKIIQFGAGILTKNNPLTAFY